MDIGKISHSLSSCKKIESTYYTCIYCIEEILGAYDIVLFLGKMVGGIYIALCSSFRHKGVSCTFSISVLYVRFHTEI